MIRVILIFTAPVCCLFIAGAAAILLDSMGDVVIDCNWSGGWWVWKQGALKNETWWGVRWGKAIPYGDGESLAIPIRLFTVL